VELLRPVILSGAFSEVERSRGVTLKLAQRDPSTSLGMTRRWPWMPV